MKDKRPNNSVREFSELVKLNSPYTPDLLRLFRRRIAYRLVRERRMDGEIADKIEL